MTWVEEMRELLRQGLTHDPETTRTLVAFASTHDVHRTLDQQVETLPAICRGRARRVLRNARQVGATDERICRLLILTYNRVRETDTPL
ncbi:hypothetical protein HZA87_01520 [Candidatus Uhrbacteria bacterium]|nr:hypothetical protein [Candidatus Uhrbacteria bacterium]